MIERENLKKALAQVKRNKGAASVDGMIVGELPGYLKDNWFAIRAQLLEGTYQPQPVRRVEIPKASGGRRPLQQAVMQVPRSMDAAAARALGKTVRGPQRAAIAGAGGGGRMISGTQAVAVAAGKPRSATNLHVITSPHRGHHQFQGSA